MSVAGLRILFLIGRDAPIDLVRVEAVARALVARGAAAETWSVDESADDDALAALRERALRFAPTTFVCGWSPWAAELAAAAEIPSIHLASVWRTPPAALAPRSGGIVLFVDPPELTPGTVGRLPAAAVGPLATPPQRPRQGARIRVRLARDAAHLASELAARLGEPFGVDAETATDASATASDVFVDVGGAARPYGSSFHVAIVDHDALRDAWETMRSLGWGTAVSPGAELALRLADAIRTWRDASTATSTSDPPLVDAAADIVAAVVAGARDLVAARLPPPLPIDAIGRADLCAQLLESSPHGLFDAATVDAMVDQAIALGMPAWGPRERLVFDRRRSRDWLFRRSALYRTELRPHRRTRELAGLVPELRGAGPCAFVASPRALSKGRSFRVRTSLRADVRELEPGTRIRTFLPHPIETETQSLEGAPRVTPAPVGASLAADLGFFYGHEHTLDAGEAELAFEVEADVRIRELHVHVDDELVSAPPASAFAELRTKIATTHTTVVQRAFAVYDWMHEFGSFRQLPSGCRCDGCVTALFERERGGDCIVLAHAFVQFCKMLDVDARVARGALFGAPLDDRGTRFGLSRSVDPIVGHTWAEVHVPALGWVPVEFDPMCLRACGPSLCWDDALRADIEKDYAMLRRYAFGHLDDQRVVYSRSVLTLPPVCSHDPTAPRGQRWRPLDATRLRHRHEVERLA